MGAPQTLGAGRYHLRRRLGAGGMASVWLAHDERLDRDVAIKLIADTLADDPAWLARFEREARAAASISHPHVVPVFDFGVEAERPYLVMALIDGPTLAAALGERRHLDPARLARELLSAIAHVHGAGIVHRDVKPANILLDANGSSHLTDFGIARPSDATALTQTGIVVGTLRYLAPEVTAGAPATPASDLYAVGKVIGEVADNAGAASLGGFVERLTAARPADRPNSADAALRLLEKHLAVTDDPSTAPTRIARHRTTEPTRVVTWAPTAATGSAAQSERRGRSLLGRARSGGAAAYLALLAAAAVLLIAVVLAAGGDDSRRSSGDAPPTAAPDAPLREQLDALDGLVNRATSP